MMPHFPKYTVNPTPAKLELYKRELAIRYAQVWDEWGSDPWVSPTVPWIARKPPRK